MSCSNWKVGDTVKIISNSSGVLSIGETYVIEDTINWYENGIPETPVIIAIIAAQDYSGDYHPQQVQLPLLCDQFKVIKLKQKLWQKEN